jgi:transposase InsO family protein
VYFITRIAVARAGLYREALANFDLRGSMGRRGNPYDNAKAESFMKTLKCERVYLNEYRTFAEVVERCRSSLIEFTTLADCIRPCYLVPVQFEQSWNSAAASNASPAQGMLAGAAHYPSASNPKSTTLSASLSEMVESGDGKLFTQSEKRK